MNTLFLGLLVPAVHAGTVEAAEHRRLSDEMHMAAARGLWTGVEERYRQILLLEERGETLTLDDWWMGAQAARAVGNVVAAKERLELAARAGGTKEVVAGLDEINSRYGRLRVTVPRGWRGDRTLQPAEPPFAPDQRAALAFATERIGEDLFDGLVPIGTYSVAGRTIEVVAGDTVAAVTLDTTSEASRGGPYKLAYAGPRVSLGVAYTVAGDLTEAGQAADAGLQARSFSGTGARLGVGVEVGFTRHFGALAEVGYHNLFGPPEIDGSTLGDSETYLVAGNSVHLGYGWIAATFRVGQLGFAAGPVWGAGAATITGVDGYCVGGDTQNPGPCAEAYPYLRGDNADTQRLAGKITAGGGAVSLSYGVVDIGSLRGGIALNAGAQGDGFRWYPWGQVAFTVTPASGKGGGKG